ncbi:MAG: hypothetical protein ACREQM_14295, partial [Candidatus Dormibacteraceae bacterium]
MSPRVQLLRRREDDERHFSVLDLGSDLIKVLTMRRDGGEAVVLGVGREHMPAKALQGGAVVDVDGVI